MKIISIAGIALMAFGVSALGYDHFGMPEIADPGLSSMLGRLLMTFSIGLLVLTLMWQGNRWLREYESASRHSGATRLGSPYLTRTAPLHRRHLFDCHRTDWDIRCR